MQKLERKEYSITLDDDPMVHKIIQKATGVQSLPFASVAGLLSRAATYQPVAAFFDVHLGPEECGIDAIPQCRELWPFAAIFVITGDEDHRLIGEALASGANDFIRKPLNIHELQARFRARVAEVKERQNRDLRKIGELVLNTRNGTISWRENTTWLPPMETHLLKILLESHGQIVSKPSLKRELWGKVVVSDNSLDQKISALRRGLSEISAPFTIRSIYRKGVTFEKQKSEQSDMAS